MSRDVTAAVILNSGRLLLARRAQDQALAGAWELPGGKVELGETPHECLERELLEELGIRVRVLSRVGSNLYSYAHGSFRILAYHVKWLSGDLAPTVHDQVAWISVDEVGEYPIAPADVPIIEAIRGEREWVLTRG